MAVKWSCCNRYIKMAHDRLKFWIKTNVNILYMYFFFLWISDLNVVNWQKQVLWWCHFPAPNWMYMLLLSVWQGRQDLIFHWQINFIAITNCTLSNNKYKAMTNGYVDWPSYGHLTHAESAIQCVLIENWMKWV